LFRVADCEFGKEAVLSKLACSADMGRLLCSNIGPSRILFSNLEELLRNHLGDVLFCSGLIGIRSIRQFALYGYFVAFFDDEINILSELSPCDYIVPLGDGLLFAVFVFVGFIGSECKLYFFWIGYFMLYI
jgi:hypothetical protein